MAGRNFLFVPGPTNVPDRVMRAMMVSMEDHRSPKFPELTRELMPGLKKVFRTERGTPVPHSQSMTCTSRPRRVHMSIHRWLNWPKRAAAAGR